MRRSQERSNLVMRRDPRVNRFVHGHIDAYRRLYRPGFYSRYNVYGHYYTRWGAWYRPWYRYGFYGGWYWRLYPVYDIYSEFWNPLVCWLWADSWDDYYYRTWYGSDYDSYPDLQLRFSRPGVFYPTVAMRDLLLGVSSMLPQEQGNFRVGLIDLTNRLETILAQRVGRPLALGRNDIVVTHYQMLETAAVLDGYVAADTQQFPFKALLDLSNPTANLVFVPDASGAEPSPDQLAQLRLINDRIEQLGGTNEFPNSTNLTGLAGEFAAEALH